MRSQGMMQPSVQLGRAADIEWLRRLLWRTFAFGAFSFSAALALAFIYEVVEQVQKDF